MAITYKPTRMEMSGLKKRLVTAKRGHKLMKDKRDEMVRRFISYVRKNKELRERVEALMSEATENGYLLCGTQDGARLFRLALTYAL